MSSKIGNYLKLEKALEQITHLANIAKIIHWDAATMLQKGSAASRQQEIASFSSTIHKMEIAEEIGKLIEASLGEFDHLDDWQRSNLANAKKSYDSQTCITSEIQYEYSIASGECEFMWRQARSENNFKKLEPYLFGSGV